MVTFVLGSPLKVKGGASVPGAARVGDKSMCPADAHGCPGCAHSVVGPAIAGSPDVLINGRPAVRVGDHGIHAACCGPNTWTAAQGSPNVFVNGKPIHRLGDVDQHCGGIGRMIEGSPDVLINEGGDAASTLTGQPTVATGLGADVDALVNLSPTLAKQVEQLQKDGWSIQYGPAGGGSYANRREKRIVIDSNERGNAALVSQTIAHEAGHAMYTLPAEVPMEGRSRQEYVEANVQRHLRDEAEATMNNMKVRDEILLGGGPDIGVAGANAKQYEQTWQDYRSGAIDRNTARERIANAFGDERTSTTGEDYRTYYGKPYEDAWDQVHTSSKGGSK